MTHDPRWWQRAVIYQIYPWSFQDSNGDGIGDLPGIISRLDHLNDGTPTSLGVDAIWLSPVYPSPMKDFGYDVADYCNIDPRFGTLADFDRLLTEAHRRGIRILMDLVLNHTSDQHPWFLDSRASRRSAKRDWYLWADARANGQLPSNWSAVFGGPAWEWDEATGQYYLHSFLKEQPDLNWRNPEVRQAMFDVVRFWLDRGVDGFRLDAINWIGKDWSWPDNPSRLALRSYLRQIHVHDRDQPETHEVLRSLRTVVKTYPDAVLVGEASSDTPGGPAAFYGTGTDELHLVFNFKLLKSPWSAHRFGRVIREWNRAVPADGWPTQVLSNHDQSRHYTRYGRRGDPDTTARRARAAALLLLTLRGTPFVYYGEEIGMRDGSLRYGELRDPYTRRYWPFFTGRDPARTPMQWDTSPHAGFTIATPWLPVSANYQEVNWERESRDTDSLLSLYRRLIHIRKTCPALIVGRYHEFAGGPADCLIYGRYAPDGLSDLPGERLLVAINFSHRVQQFALHIVKTRGTLLLSTDSRRRQTAFDPERTTLNPEEGILVRLNPS
ncbi:MAG TPA: alpha-glucosidase [Nitrospiraceae bacterium]|nr:alpha-glucosidase [Nitrospiraceae bacterium]